jgi:hypothetical protein
MTAGATPEQTAALDRYGRRMGAAFQVQDDVLDLMGDEDVVGKTLGRDLKKGKLTLPLIRHLAALDASATRQCTLRALEAVSELGGDDDCPRRAASSHSLNTNRRSIAFGQGNSRRSSSIEAKASPSEGLPFVARSGRRSI